MSTPSKNRIRNIDEIVTQSGTVIDLENIQASGSGGSVSASGLAISRSEDSQYIDYAFNEGATNTHEADGHSSSASESMIVGAWQSNAPQSYIDKVAFSDGAVTSDFASLGTSTSMQAVGSNGSEVMSAGGGGGSTYRQGIEKILFSASATVSPWGQLSKAKNALSTGSSDGDHMLIHGGYSGGATYLTDCEKKDFASNADSTDHGALTIGGKNDAGQAGYESDASDGTVSMRVNSYTLVTHATQRGFADGSVDEEWGDTVAAEWGCGSGSNKVHAIYCGGSGNGYNSDKKQAKSFSDKSLSEQWGTMNDPKHGPAGSSNGQVLILSRGSNNINYSELYSFDSSSTSNKYGAFTNLGESNAGSGNA